MIKRPPQHRADAPILFIHEHDDAWRSDDIARERKETPKGAKHPVDRYLAGETRFDLDALMTVSGQVVTARQYLRDDSTPTVFRLRRVSGEERNRVLASFATKDPVASHQAQVSALWRLCRAGLVEVTEGFDGPPWDMQGGQHGRPLTDDDMQQLYDADPGLPPAIGWAVFHASAPLSEAEGKR